MHRWTRYDDDLRRPGDRETGTSFPGGTGGSRVPLAEGPGIELDPLGAGPRAVRDFTGRGPKGYRRSDAAIREELCERLTHDPEVDPSDVEVVVGEGEVLLVGTVEDRATKRRIEDLAYAIRGVQDVNNLLRLGPAIHAPRPEFAPGDFELEIGRRR